MHTTVKKELVLHAINWTNNILVQVLGSYGDYNQDGREHLKQAISHLQEAENHYRTKD